LCININGKVTSMFNLQVDQYTALTLTGSACAVPRALPRPAARVGCQGAAWGAS
jgi:hypothetical protein